MASPEIESHARAMLANRLVAVRRLDEALKSVDEATQALRDARARARSEYVAARRAGWSTYELNRLGLSRDRGRRVPRRDSSADVADAAGTVAAAGSAPGDLPSRTAPREAAPMTAPDRVPSTTGGGFRDAASQSMTDLFRPRSRPSEESEPRVGGSPETPADPPKDTAEADTATVAPPQPLPARPTMTPAAVPSSLAAANGATRPAAQAAPETSRDDATGDSADDVNGTPSEETLERGDWYVDTQSAKTTATSTIPSPGLATASTGEERSG